MPGESILVIDESLAVQDIAKTALQAAGYRVTTASNGAAALTYPDLDEVGLIILDSAMEGLNGEATTRILKSNEASNPIPTLMLVPEDQMPERESIELEGIQAWLLKPFESRALVRKVSSLLAQKNLDELAKDFLAKAADRMMDELAEKQIIAAVERKTEIIAQRSIQKVSTTIDQHARSEIDHKITSLSSEKEQDLVKLTVREVAQSMVEKLAASKVEEAMQAILRGETERAVRRVGDQMLPNIIRERTKDMIANILPREVENRLTKAAEKMVPEISNQIVGTVEAVASKAVPRIARDTLPSVVEQQVRMAVDKTLHQCVSDLVNQELSRQISDKMEPTIRDSVRRIRSNVLTWNMIFAVLLTTGLGVAYYFLFYGPPQ